jgi:hypothetical protein
LNFYWQSTWRYRALKSTSAYFNHSGAWFPSTPVQPWPVSACESLGMMVLKSRFTYGTLLGIPWPCWTTISRPNNGRTSVSYYLAAREHDRNRRIFTAIHSAGVLRFLEICLWWSGPFPLEAHLQYTIQQLAIRQRKPRRWSKLWNCGTA